MQCGALCVNLLTDNANCGACGVACPPGLVCSASSCAATCVSGYATCGTDAGAYCANLAADFYNCGNCGTACVPGDFCSAGSCKAAPSSCPAGQTLCVTDGGISSCNDLQSDPNHCGTCGQSCNAWQTCLGGNCQSAGQTVCPAGLMACPLGDGGTSCIDTMLDPDNCGGCGQTCGADGVCRTGACICPSYFTQCGVAPAFFCTLATEDRGNCGSCGHSCIKCESCETGQCTAQDFFGPAVTLPEYSVGSGGPVLADLNRDGYLDLVYSGNTSGGPFIISISYGGDGGFRGSGSVGTYFEIGDSMSYQITTIAADDLNGDGFIDLAVTWTEFVDAGMYNNYDIFSEAAVVFGMGASGFFLPDGGLWVAGPFVVTSTSYDYIVAMVTGDFNGDGLEDFAVLAGNGGPTAFYQIDGGFSQAPIQTGIDAGDGLYGSLASGDVDFDGITDLIIGVSWGAPTPVIALISANGEFLSSSITVPVFNYQSPALAVDSDGVLHVIADELRTFRYVADSGFIDAGEYPLPESFPPGGANTTGMSVDFNDDDQSDFVAFSGAMPGAAVWLKNGGRYDDPVAIPFANSMVGTAGAVNGDSLPDLIFLSASAGTGVIVPNNYRQCSQ
jgi:hypothetical protein